MHRLAALATLLPLALAADCPHGAYVIVARASDEPAGFGIIGAVKDQIVAAIAGSRALAVDYPATIDDYFNSETAGVRAMRDDITSFVDGCPNTPVVVMGYSQGAQVTGDALVGQDDKYFTDNSTVDKPLAQKYADAIKCVILMGDPAFNATSETAFHVGNATKGGYFPRQDASEFDTLGLTTKTKSYCDTNDMYCDSGDSLAVHVGYVSEYGDQAAQFCIKQLGGASSNSTNSTSTSMMGSMASMTSAMASASATGTSATGGSGGTSATATGSAATATATGSSGAMKVLGGSTALGAMLGAMAAGVCALM